MTPVKAFVALAACASLSAFGQGNPPPLPPLLSVTSPTGTVFVPSFPATVPVSIGVTMQELALANLTQFDVSSNDTSLVPGGQFNPFNQQNACSVPAPLTCQTSATNPTTQATITIPIVINAPGNFPLTVTTKLQRTTGELNDAVNVLLLAVEFPAPPAVANEYINTSGLKSLLNAKQRGCVISWIAQKHAQESAYGPKGGPYDVTKIQQDVTYQMPYCGR
jgi:hypothetical protein